MEHYGTNQNVTDQISYAEFMLLTSLELPVPPGCWTLSQLVPGVGGIGAPHLLHTKTYRTATKYTQVGLATVACPMIS